jgi:hypothetical protein
MQYVMQYLVAHLSPTVSSAFLIIATPKFGLMGWSHSFLEVERSCSILEVVLEVHVVIFFGKLYRMLNTGKLILIFLVCRLRSKAGPWTNIWSNEF